MEGANVVGVIDVARMGIADRHQDLAILWNCMAEFDHTLQQRIFTRYGIASPDERKLRFHIMLDECF
jgi:aminoglycoside 3'-phosphotransferase I